MATPMRKAAATRWIGNHMIAHTTGERKEQAVAFSITHLQGGSIPKEIKNVRLGTREWSPQEIANILWSAAENHAGGIPGTQQYDILVLVEGLDTPLESFPFRLSGEQDMENIGQIATEPPTTQGITSMFMRTHEGLAKTYIAGFHQLVGQMGQVMDRQATHIEKLTQENYDAIVAIKEVMLKSVAEDHQKAMELEAFRRQTEERGKVIGALPAIANAITGVEIFPQSMADTAMIDSLAESLTGPQIAQLATILEPKQLVLLQTRIEQAMKKKQARDEAAKAADKVPE